MVGKEREEGEDEGRDADEMAITESPVMMQRGEKGDGRRKTGHRREQNNKKQKGEGEDGEGRSGEN